MALSRKLSTIYIRKKDGGTNWQYTITTNNLVSEIGQVNYGSAFDEAVDGALRHNFRGYRVTVTLDWAKLSNSTFTGNTYANASTPAGLLNDIRSSLTASTPDEYIEISFTGTGDWIPVVPSSITYSTTYTNQIGRGAASFTLVGRNLLTSIDSYLEAPEV